LLTGSQLNAFDHSDRHRLGSHHRRDQLDERVAKHLGGARKALEDLKAHRQRLASELKSINTVLDLTQE
jgi:hypothetical protein